MLRVTRLVIITFVLSACAVNRGTSSLNLEGPSARSAGITVQNGHGADISVYATDGRAHMRLGTVEMFSTRTFILPRAIALPSELRLHIVSRVDGHEFMSPVFVARNGDFFVLNVENSTQFSSLLRR